PALLLEIQTARPSVAAPSGPEKPGSRIRAVTRFVRALMRISFPVALVTTQTVEPRTATPCGPDRNPSLIVLTTRFVAESMRWTVPRSKLVTQTAPAPTARYRASRSTGIRATIEFDSGSMRVTAPSLCEIQTAPAPKEMPSGPSDGPTWIVAIARFVRGSIRARRRLADRESRSAPAPGRRAPVDTAPISTNAL